MSNTWADGWWLCRPNYRSPFSVQLQLFRSVLINVLLPIYKKNGKNNAESCIYSPHISVDQLHEFNSNSKDCNQRLWFEHVFCLLLTLKWWQWAIVFGVELNFGIGNQSKVFNAQLVQCHHLSQLIEVTDCISHIFKIEIHILLLLVIIYLDWAVNICIMFSAVEMWHLFWHSFG